MAKGIGHAFGKKGFALLLACILALPMISLAKSIEKQTIVLDESMLGSMIDLPEYCELTPTAFLYEGSLNYYYKQSGYTGIYTDTWHADSTEQYAKLRFSLLNTQTIPFNVMSDISNIIVTYDGKYEYTGSMYQCDPNLEYSWRPLLKDLRYEIKPLYEGRFLIVCILPNAVVNGDKPLTLTFTFGEHEIVYLVRK